MNDTQKSPVNNPAAMPQPAGTPLDSRQVLENARLAYRDKSKINFKVIIIISAFVAGLFALTRIGTIARTPYAAEFGALIPMTIIQFGFFILFGCVFALIAKSLMSSKEHIAYRNAYKAHFVAKALKEIFTDISYSHNMGMPYDTINATGMMYMGDRYSSNDFVKATYKGHPFQQADVTIQREDRDSDGDRTYVTVFKGRYAVFDLSKKFDHRMLAAGTRFACARADKKAGFKKMELESIIFNKHFKVYAQDGFETFYLLDPAFMERLDTLWEQYAGSVMVCFYNNQMHIAIHDNRDLFEPPSAKNPIDDKAETQKIKDQIKLITDLIDNLKIQ